MNYNFIAPYYHSLSQLIFLNRQHQAHFVILKHLKENDKILWVGGGAGKFIAEIEKLNLKLDIDYVDFSSKMIDLAQKNLDKYDHRNQIILKEGDAADILRELSGPFDVIFMDSAKSKYIEFLPIALDLLSENGVILMDDIFQGGEILTPIMEIKRNQRALERGLRKLFDEVLDNPKYLTSILPLGDGLLMIKKA